MLPKPAYTTREWPVEKARATVRVLLTETAVGDIYTSVSTLKTDWEHFPGSAVRHERITEAEDRVEMLVQGGALLMIAPPKVAEPEPARFDGTDRVEAGEPMFR